MPSLPQCLLPFGDGAQLSRVPPLDLGQVRLGRLQRVRQGADARLRCRHALLERPRGQQVWLDALAQARDGLARGLEPPAGAPHLAAEPRPVGVGRVHLAREFLQPQIDLADAGASRLDRPQALPGRAQLRANGVRVGPPAGAPALRLVDGGDSLLGLLQAHLMRRRHGVLLPVRAERRGDDVGVGHGVRVRMGGAAAHGAGLAVGEIGCQHAGGVTAQVAQPVAARLLLGAQPSKSGALGGDLVHGVRQLVQRPLLRPELVEARAGLTLAGLLGRTRLAFAQQLGAGPEEGLQRRLEFRGSGLRALQGLGVDRFPCAQRGELADRLAQPLERAQLLARRLALVGTRRLGVEVGARLLE